MTTCVKSANSVALFVNCSAIDLSDYINSDPKLKQEFPGLRLPGTRVQAESWIFVPHGPDLWHLMVRKPQLSLEAVERWVETDEFHDFRLEQLEKEFKNSLLESETLNDVRMAVFGWEPRAVLPLHKGLKKMLPNAQFYVSRNGYMLSPLGWRLSVRSLELSPSTLDLLNFAFINNVEELSAKAPADLQRIPGCTADNLREVMQELQDKGFAR